MSKLYVNVVGTDLLLDTGIDLSDINEQHIIFRKPDGVTVGSFAASLFSSYSVIGRVASTSYLKHTLATGDLNQPGEWRFQPYVANATGTWYGEMAKETVYSTYD